MRECLEAIATQTVQPFEVIVVDNNSTDQTVTIARTFPFATIITEKRQGVLFARETGFNAARGDIIGRIDADTSLDPTWVANVQAIFADGTVAIATGKMRYREMAGAWAANAVDLFARRYLAWRLGREVAVQGANMAIRRAVWLKARRDTCHQGGLHEDYDVAIHVNWRGGLVVFDERMVATIGYRLADIDFSQFRDYCYTSTRTYFRHGLLSGREMYPIIWLVLICYLPLKILRRGYDSKTGRFSWRHMFTDTGTRRVNPVTFGDFSS